MVPSEFMNGLPVDVTGSQDQNNFNGLNISEAFLPGNSVTPSPPNSAGNGTNFVPLGSTVSQPQQSQNFNYFLSGQTNSFANNFAQQQFQQNQQQHPNLIGAMDNDLVTTVRANLSRLEELRKEIEAQAKQINLGNYNITSIKSSNECSVTNNINGMGMNGGMGVRDMNALSSGGNNKGAGNSSFPQAAFNNMRNGNVPNMGMNFAGNMMQNNGPGMMPNGMNFLNGQANSLQFGNNGVNMGNSSGTGDDPDSPTRNNSGPRVSFHENLINAPEASAASRASFLERNGRRMDLSWHSDEHLPLRREVVKFIAQLLAARKSNPTRKWLSELPYKARKLEERLYRSADSIEDYLNKKTLKERLKKVATEITCKYRDAKRQTSQDKMNRPNNDMGDLFGGNNPQNGSGQGNQGPNDSFAQLSAHLQSGGFRRPSGQSGNFPLGNSPSSQGSQGLQRNLSIGDNNQNPSNLQEQLLMSMRSQQMSALWNSNLNPALNNNNNNGNDNSKQQQLLLQQQFLQQQQMLLQVQNRVGSANSVGGNMPNMQNAASNSMNNNNGGAQTSQNGGNMNKMNNATQNQQGPSPAAANLNTGANAAQSIQQLSALFNNNPQMQQNNSNNNSNNNNANNSNNRNINSSSPLPIDADMFASEADTADFLDVPQDFDWLGDE